ncbi:hypothetical protein [Paratractidigestivibacter sp.]|uniref:hypothetical protein n=1 Tax=Paratractidigestivibacter sp. TaxID=2847316 RepID=UPI002AC98973|nr:hypothetical protein [Paratractidigestivibacter sp.]
MQNEIEVRYGDVSRTISISLNDVAEYMATLYGSENLTLMKMALLAFESAFDLRNRVGYAELVGKCPEFKTFLANKYLRFDDGKR